MHLNRIRALRAAALGIAGLLSGSWALAATPPAGALTLTSGPISYSAGPFYYNNAQSGSTCLDPVFPCDQYTLTVNIPADYVASHPDDLIRITWRWPNAVEDYDYTIYNAANQVIAQAGTASDPEITYLPPVPGTFRIEGSPFLVAGGSFTGLIELVRAVDAPLPPAASGIAPQYLTYAPPSTLGNSAGEPSIGYNPRTRRAMFLSSTQTLRVTFPENREPVLPATCDASWENVSFQTTGTITLDPILFTDLNTGRTFVSQMISAILAGPANAGANSLFAYTDDDGKTWTQGQIGPPEGGYDHQSVGGGPYPASVPLGNASNGGSAVYYCSQAGTSAFCARSDDGGLTFPTGVPIYNVVTDGFGGLHGHIKVAPDGTVYVPSRACGEQQCVAVSSDAGTTWTVRKVPGSTQGDSDPSVGIARDGSLYFCYLNGDGRVHAQVSRNKGVSWGRDYDLGASKGVKIAVFPEAVAGDPDRATCAFLGTDRGGNHSAADFQGIWYPYMATTYDGGLTWHTVNTTPTDPVQREGGVCTAGSSCGSNRNLLDFNEITMDEKGRPLFGYADGCTGTCANGGARTFTRIARIARQSTGRSLLAAFDPPANPAPAASCLAGTRNESGSHLTWRVPSDAGAAINGYRVYRRTATGSEALVGSTTGKAAFDDASADPAISPYYYRVTALSANGEGETSNTVGLPIAGGAVTSGSACYLPGITVLTDALADATTRQAANELQSLSVSHPYAEDGVQKVVFRLKVEALGSSLPAATAWFASFNAPDGKVHGVKMQTSAQGAVSYVSYIAVAAPGSTAVDGRTAMAGSENAAVSGGYSPLGEVIIAVKPADLGLSAPNQALTGFNAGVVQQLTVMGMGSSQSLDEMPAALARAGSLPVPGNAACAPNTPPLASLEASVLTGPAPLTVTFTISGSDADGDALSRYSLSFGDGTELLDQPFGTEPSLTLSHTYNERGNYPVQLVVADARQALSTNLAEKVIEVVQNVTAFRFIERVNVPVNSFVTSETVTMAGFSGTVLITVPNGGQFRINNGSFTNQPGQIAAGDTLTLRHRSASAENTATESLVRVGPYSTAFRSLTTTLDRVPEAFSFGSLSGQEAGALVPSAAITLGGFDTAVPIVAGPEVEYRLGSGAWTRASGTLQNSPGTKAASQTLQVRHTTSASHLAYTKSYLKVGGVTGSFITRTK